MRYIQSYNKKYYHIILFINEVNYYIKFNYYFWESIILILYQTINYRNYDLISILVKIYSKIRKFIFENFENLIK